MTFLEFGKKILDRLPDTQYQKLNNLCDLIKFNYACRIKDENELQAKIEDVIASAINSNEIVNVGIIMKLCKEYYKK